jgi:hypothetical protein
MLRTRELWLLLALTLPAVLPLTAPGYFFDAHDAQHSVFFLVEFDQAIRDGALWPRWGPDQALGFGYPTWVLIAPLAYYVGELFHLLGAGFTVAVKLTWGLATFVAAFSMFALVRRWWGRTAGLLAALLYVYAPFHLVDIYVRADLAEFVALSLLPLVLLAFWNLIDSGGLRRLALAALSYGALALCHTLTLLIFTPLLGGFILVALYVASRRSREDTGTAVETSGRPRRVADRKQVALRAVLVAGAIVLALGLAGIFLLPMIFERQFVALEQWVHGTYQYQQHFVYPHQFLSPIWDYGFAVEGPNDGMSFQLGLLPVLLAAAGTATALRGRSRDRALALFFAAATLATLWTMTSYSQTAWRLLPLVALIQFPWRLLALTSLNLAILGGAAVGMLSERGTRAPPSSRPAPYIVAVLTVFASLSYATPLYTEATARDESVLAVLDFELQYPDMRGMTAWSSRLPTTEDSPLVAQYLAGQDLTKAYIIEGEGALEPMRHGGASEELRVNSADGVRLQFYTYWFPGWEAKIDGQPVDTWPEGENGLLTLDVPAGDHHVLLRMTENTPPRRVGGILSALSLAAIIGLLSGWGIRRR